MQYGAHFFCEPGFLQMDAKLVFRDFSQNRDGIVEHVLPPARGEFVEQILRFLIPAPPKIPGKFMQARDQSVQFQRC
jgi:hypothetical protein